MTLEDLGVAQTLGIGSVYLIGGLLLLVASCYGAIAVRTVRTTAGGSAGEPDLR